MLYNYLLQVIINTGGIFMRKILFNLILLVMLVSAFAGNLYASDDNVKVYINEKIVSFPDAEPYIDFNGRTQVPIRFISEALNAKVEWDGENRTVKIMRDGIVVQLTIDQDKYYINGKSETMDTRTFIKDGRTFVPLRFVSEALGAQVDWDAKSRNVYITKSVEKYKPSKLVISTEHSSYIVDDKGLYETNKIDYSSIPSLYSGHLIVPIRQLAGIFEGDYYENGDKAVLEIDDTVFEFDLYKNTARVNGKEITLPVDTRYENGVVKVSAEAFKYLENYYFKTYSNAMILRRKDVYYENGQLKKDSPVDVEPTSFIKDLDNYSWGLSKEENDKLRKKVHEISDKIISEIIKPGMTDYEKIYAINQYMVDNVTYDFSNRGLWDAFLYKKGVCDTFAHCTGLLLEKAGIESVYIIGYAQVDGRGDIDEYEIMGYSNNSHAWNLVKLNGKYYHLDTTWNRGLAYEDASLPFSYDYFLLSDEQIQLDHAWRHAHYPKADTFCDSKIVSEMDAKGYTVISGEIDATDIIERTFVKISVSSESPSMVTKRIIKVEPGTVTPFAIILDGKQYSKNKISVDIDTLLNDSQQVYINQGKDVTKGLSITKDGLKYKVKVNDKEHDSISGTIILPEGMVADEDYNFTVKLTIMKPIETGHSVSPDGMITYNGTIKKGESSSTIKLKLNLPTYFYRYKLEYYFSGGTNCPFLPIGIMDSSGNIHPDGNYIIDGPVKNNIKIQVPENPDYIPQQSYNKTFILGEKEKEDLKQKLIGFYFGNHAVISKLATNEDAIALEKKEPVEVDKNGTIYYSITTDYGINIFRSYNLNNKGKKGGIIYSITLNDIEFNSENYVEIFDYFNNLLKNCLGKETASYNIYYRKGDAGNLSKEQLFNEIGSGYASIEANYIIDGYIYHLSFLGYDSNYDISFIVSYLVS